MTWMWCFRWPIAFPYWSADASSPPVRPKKFATTPMCEPPISAKTTMYSQESSMLKVEGLKASYGPSQILFGIDLEVRHGEMVTILGRNGMGKTTTIRAIMGMTPPHGGTATFEGRELRGLS